MAKRYYWLKLKEDFFGQKEIKRLRRLAGGDTFTIIYLKLLLLSLKTDGKIYFDGIGENFADELSLEIDEEAENISLTLAYLQAKGLLDLVNESEYFMSDIPSMIGSESESASRVRKLRNKALQCNANSLQSNNDVTKCNTEKEIELDKEKEKEKDIYIPFSEIISYLNERAQTNYRASSQKTKTLIKARWSEGFTLNDFKTVIDKKVAEWLNSDMCKYLRPETLFGTKFESYLNQKIRKGKVSLFDQGEESKRRQANIKPLTQKEIEELERLEAELPY